MLNRKIFTSFTLILVSVFLTQCVSKNKGLVYDPEKKLALDVYSPKKKNTKRDVLVFIHGGNWRSGNRSTYKFSGRGLPGKVW